MDSLTESEGHLKKGIRRADTGQLRDCWLEGNWWTTFVECLLEDESTMFSLFLLKIHILWRQAQMAQCRGAWLIPSEQRAALDLRDVSLSSMLDREII